MNEGQSITDTMFCGTFKATLLNHITGAIFIGRDDYMDEYDSNMDGRIAMDFATCYGRPGGKDDSKDFKIYGYGNATLPIEKTTK